MVCSLLYVVESFEVELCGVYMARVECICTCIPYSQCIYVSGFAKRDHLGLCKRISTGVNSRKIEISRKCGLLHHYNL